MKPKVSINYFSMVENTAILILDNIPIGTEFGIDLNVWITDVNFRGLCEIPAGPHYIFIRQNNKYNDVSQRYGLFYCFSECEVVIYHCVFDNGLPIIRKINNINYINQFDTRLAPYPLNKFEIWSQMSNFLTKQLVEKISPKLENEYDIEFKFSKFEKVLYPDKATPSEITKHSMDKSYTLEKILEKNYERKCDILGELQIAFIGFLIGQNFEAFEQWKNIVLLMCQCDEIILKEQLLFNKFLQILTIHFKEITSDYLCLDHDNKKMNVLWKNLKVFFKTIESIKHFEINLKCCKNVLKRCHDWQFSEMNNSHNDDDDDDEDKPIVVDF